MPPVAAATAGAVCISSSAVLMKLASTASPSVVAFGRCAFALPVLGALALRERRRGGSGTTPMPPCSRWLARLAGVFLAGPRLAGAARADLAGPRLAADHGVHAAAGRRDDRRAAADPAGRFGGTQLRDPGRAPLAAPARRRGAGADRRGGRGDRPGAAGPLPAAQDEDDPPRGGRVDRHVAVEVAVAGRDGEAAVAPDGRGQLGRGPEAVRHDVD